MSTYIEIVQLIEQNDEKCNCLNLQMEVLSDLSVVANCNIFCSYPINRLFQALVKYQPGNPAFVF